MASVKESTEKPSLDDFKLGRQLGEGNFSRIMLATHIATGEEFALKVIEKQRIKRLKVRHPNIYNEINMEKEVLNRARHPNVIRLYQTFQDEMNLYFLLEYLQGGELLQQLLHENHQVGLHEDLARFYLADIANAVDYLHDNAIMHRDLKPENMVVSADDGHLRLIDFGTAKDLENPSLNGPNFVGTPEYMAPETVDNKDTTFAGDVWAFGCITFQLLAGETPFSGGSVYLTLLKVQAGTFTMPTFLSEAAQDLIRRCLHLKPEARPTIKEIKAHPFFQNTDFEYHMSVARPTTQYANAALFGLVQQLHDADKARALHEPLRTFADDVQSKVEALNERDRALLMHLLERKQLLHLTSVYPRFFASPSQGRCLLARNGGYVGLSHNLQNQWSDAFTFMLVGGPALSFCAKEAEAEAFRRRVITPINAQPPAFVVFCGDMIDSTPQCGTYTTLATQCQELLNEIHPEVKLVFAPGTKTFTGSATEEARAAYADRFGADRFSFWHGGIKFIVLNSSVFASRPDQARELEEWLTKELENGKLCARETVVLSAHSFHSLVQGPELPPHLATSSSSETNQDNPDSLPGISMVQKKRIVELLAQYSVRLIVTTEGPENRVITVQTTRNPNASADEEDEVKKTEMVVCSPLALDKEQKRNGVIHVATVGQSGLTVSQLKTYWETPKTIDVAAPKDVHIALASETSKLGVSRDATTA